MARLRLFLIADVRAQPSAEGGVLLVPEVLLTGLGRVDGLHGCLRRRHKLLSPRDQLLVRDACLVAPALENLRVKLSPTRDRIELLTQRVLLLVVPRHLHLLAAGCLRLLKVSADPVLMAEGAVF